jgi:hypothetical protein
MTRPTSFLPWCLLVVSGCGSGDPLAPDAVAFWRFTASTVAYASCPDSPAFLESAPPLDALGTYLVYRISGDGASAVQQTCGSFDPASCTAAPTGLTWTVDAGVLRTSQELKDAVGADGCSLVQDERWTMTVSGRALQVVISDALSLVGLGSACSAPDSSVRNQSSNRVGLDGCVVTYGLTGSLR